jgi:uncharacterized hydrophobic protein (TIGR00341 family)
MALRLIEIFLPKGEDDRVREVLKDKTEFGIWQEQLSDSRVLTRTLVQPEKAEELMDALEGNFSTAEGFRVILLSVEATLPRPEQPKENSEAADQSIIAEEQETKKKRISREELYEEIDEAINLSWVFILLTVLSAVVAVIGIERSNIAIIIGAMVIAPLLGPNVALALATTLGDMDLAKRALKANISGILVALVVAIVLGFFLAVSPDIPEVESRTRVGIEDIVLALAAGSAGTLSFTTGLSSAIIGVMVAVSLLPPLATCGMLLGAGFEKQALGAFLLFFTNVVCINLAGVITFLIQGIQPRTWWEADKARKATRTAIALWTTILLILAILILIIKTEVR